MRLCKYEGWVVETTSYVGACSVILSQLKDQRVGAVWQDLEVLTTARAKEFRICQRRVI